MRTHTPPVEDRGAQLHRVHSRPLERESVRWEKGTEAEDGPPGEPPTAGGLRQESSSF